MRLQTALRENLRVLQLSFLAFVLLPAIVVALGGGGTIALAAGLVGGLFWIPCATLFIGFQLIADDPTTETTSAASPQPEPDPISEARDRYLRGEIDEEEFEARLDRLLDGASKSSRDDRETELATERR